MRNLRSRAPGADMDAAGRGADMDVAGYRAVMAARLGPWLAKLLALSGYDTVDKLRVAGDAELLEVLKAAGVGEADLWLIREAVG